MTDSVDPAEGRHLYGRDPETYALGRPDYPDRVYEVLVARCALASTTHVVEIGPGTGLVTRRLLHVGARVTAVEPNAAMARHLIQTMSEPRLEVVVEVFEEASLPESGFDLAVAATSFHWVARPRGMEQLRRVVRPDGWVAIWWMLFEVPTKPDELSRVVESLVGRPPGPASKVDGPPFQIDEEARRQDLSGAGFVDVDSEIIPSMIELDAAGARALYASMAVVLRLPADEQARILDTVESIVRQQFGGCIRRQLVTAIYTARNTPASCYPRGTGSRRRF